MTWQVETSANGRRMFALNTREKCLFQVQCDYYLILRAIKSFLFYVQTFLFHWEIISNTRSSKFYLLLGYILHWQPLLGIQNTQLSHSFLPVCEKYSMPSHQLRFFINRTKYSEYMVIWYKIKSQFGPLLHRYVNTGSARGPHFSKYAVTCSLYKNSEFCLYFCWLSMRRLDAAVK